jgi:hypothetical protein
VAFKHLVAGFADFGPVFLQASEDGEVASITGRQNFCTSRVQAFCSSGVPLRWSSAKALVEADSKSRAIVGRENLSIVSLTLRFGRWRASNQKMHRLAGMDEQDCSHGRPQRREAQAVKYGQICGISQSCGEASEARSLA